jgi:hypothetical protein
MASDADSDKLLRESGNLGKEAGCYTESALHKQKERHEIRLYEDYIPQKVTVQLEGIRWGSVRKALQRSQCHTRAIACLELSLMGMSYTQISERKYIAVSRATVCRDIQAALRILRADCSLGLIEVIADIFSLPVSVVVDILRVK